MQYLRSTNRPNILLQHLYLTPKIEPGEWLMMLNIKKKCRDKTRWSEMVSSFLINSGPVS